MTGEAREELIESLVRGLIKEARNLNPSLSLRIASLSIESRRLAQILGEWLELELQRAPFTVVNVEDDVRLSIADVEFYARLDRG